MFSDARIGAIIATRGGYGSGRLLDQLDYDFIASHPKILVGFSDITALSMALLAKTGMITFAGPMLAAEFGEEPDPAMEKAFWEMLTLRRPARLLARGDEQVMHPGRAEGTLIGGNMAVFCSLIGTEYMPDPEGSILFLEDIGENVYRIDRMLMQMKYAGILKAAAGIVLGRFTAIPEDTPNRDLDDVLKEYLLPLDIPVLTHYPFGHIPDKLILPTGAQVRIDTNRVPLTLMQAVVE
jgi:muramoyltetrapeptide carboxypeptidase